MNSYFDNVGTSSGGVSDSGPGNMSGGSNEGKSLEDVFYRKECELSELASANQFTMAVVYSWGQAERTGGLKIQYLQGSLLTAELRKYETKTWIAEYMTSPIIPSQRGNADS